MNPRNDAKNLNGKLNIERAFFPELELDLQVNLRLRVWVDEKGKGTGAGCLFSVRVNATGEQVAFRSFLTRIKAVPQTYNKLLEVVLERAVQRTTFTINEASALSQETVQNDLIVRPLLQTYLEYLRE